MITVLLHVSFNITVMVIMMMKGAYRWALLVGVQSRRSGGQKSPSGVQRQRRGRRTWNEVPQKLKHI